jgi:cathepsin D
MAYPSLSQLHHSPVFNTEYSNGAVKANRFGFYLAQSGSELYLGGIDTRKYSGKIETHSVNQAAGFWQLPGASAKVGKSVAVSGFQTVIDSGTTIMYAVSLVPCCEY